MVAERTYAAYEHADREERTRLIATSAKKFARNRFGLKGGGNFPAISTRTLGRAVWLRSSRWVKLLRFRLTAQRPVLKAALPVQPTAQATQAVDGRAWRRPMHRALRITHTVSMAAMSLLATTEHPRTLTRRAGGHDAWRRRRIAS